MPRTLFTIGYEGLDISSFVSRLKDNSIECIIDVRAMPLSRKRGFSKTSLSQRLESEDIGYVHFKELGSPKALREGLKQTGDYGEFFKKMDEYLSSKKESIEQAYGYVITSNCCLMCFENLAAACHRKIVAKKIKERDGNGLRISNI